MGTFYPDWSETTEILMRAAGWFPGRSEASQVARWRHDLTARGRFQMPLIAERVLEEFGGVHVNADGPGLECARGGFCLDPTLARGEEDRFDGFGTWEGSALFPLGEIYDSYFFLGIAADGSVYIVGDSIRRLARNIRMALDSILLGRGTEEAADPSRD
jgi:hypothetical protein